MNAMDNQSAYWDSVAESKTFTHPLDLDTLSAWVSKDAHLLDFGCGYGRSVAELLDAGYRHVVGYDTSAELIARGKKAQDLPLHLLADPLELPVADASQDCILLVAVLTCIPSNRGQSQLVAHLRDKLKPGGILLVSDYLLQPKGITDGRYGHLDGDSDNYGVFTLPEGVTLRHHTQAWVDQLFSAFHLRHRRVVPITTMNGNPSEVFQLILQK